MGDSVGWARGWMIFLFVSQRFLGVSRVKAVELGLSFDRLSFQNQPIDF
jgi:hypothetical protein